MIFADYLVAAVLVVGGIFGVIGSYGLLKLRDTMQRLHAPTKATTVGLGAVLVASMALLVVHDGRLSWHELLVTLFLLLTAPISANFLAKAQLHLSRDRSALPPTGVTRDWATFEADAPPRDGPPRS
jgi:multicomponent K+:H+ antiporter subunit G